MMRTEELTLNVGPQHPSTHGVLRLVVTLDGERITHVEPVIGYLHRGTEKLAEGLNFTQIIPYTDRMDYLAAMLNNYCLVHAVETLMGLEIPERAEYLRVITMELNRVASHLVWFGTYLLDIGALSPFLFAFNERETILNLFNELCGARMTYNYMRVGGVKWDAPEGWLKKVDEFVQRMKKKVDEFHTLVTGNEIFINRMRGVGKYDAETALAFGLSGVNLRCTGVDYDIRKFKPYSIYDRFEFDVPLSQDGDCYARYLLRLEEIRQSLHIVEQALAQIPDGPVMAKVPKMLRPPKGEVFTSIEGARGELGVHIVSDGKDKPYRIKWRRPSFVNLQILPKLAVGLSMSDMVAVLGAIDIVLGEVDG